MNRQNNGGKHTKTGTLGVQKTFIGITKSEQTNGGKHTRTGTLGVTKWQVQIKLQFSMTTTQNKHLSSMRQNSVY